MPALPQYQHGWIAIRVMSLSDHNRSGSSRGLVNYSRARHHAPPGRHVSVDGRPAPDARRGKTGGNTREAGLPPPNGMCQQNA